MVRLNQEEGRYRVLLRGVGDDTEQEKESFSQRLSQTFRIDFPLLKRIVDRCPIVLKKNLPLKKAEILAKSLRSFGATVSVERRNFPPVSLEFQELAPYRLALKSASLRKTQKGLWSVVGRARNISDEALSDAWVVVQLFDYLEEFIAFEETPLAINPLPPGEISPFKVILEGDFFVRTGSVAFKNASGEPIPAVDERKKNEWVEVDTEDEDVLASSCVFTGFGEKFHVIEELREPSEKTGLGKDKDIPSGALPSEQEELLPLLFEGGPRMKEEGNREGIPPESLWLTLEPLETISESSSSLLEENRHVTQGVDGAAGEEAVRPERLEGPIGEEGGAGEIEQLCDGEVPEASRLDASVFEKTTRLLEDISEGPGEKIETHRKMGKRADEEPLSFPWMDDFREAVQSFYQKPKDVFSIWFEECRKEGEFKDSLHALLTILVRSRFDQGNESIKALENTQRVSQLVVRPNLPLNEIPPLEETPFVSGQVWRELFHRALPKIQQIGNTILERSRWKGFELECLIQVIPHMGYQNSRMAIRWFKELIPDILAVDFSDTPVTVGQDLYRVAARLGIVDPHFDHYQSRHSMADVKIQSFARMAYPQHPLEVEKPMAMMGEAEERGGHCFPVQPRCEGCLFETFCPKLYVRFNPSEKGMRVIESPQRSQHTKKFS